MKVEKLDGSLEKGFGMLRKDNNPWRARESSLSSQWLTEEILIIGGFLNAQTVPMVVFGLVVLLVVFRLFFGRCPGCGKLLPFWGVSKSCPFCGIRLK